MSSDAIDVSNLGGNPQLLFMERLEEVLEAIDALLIVYPPATWDNVVGLYDKFIMIIVNCIIDY